MTRISAILIYAALNSNSFSVPASIWYATVTFVRKMVQNNIFYDLDVLVLLRYGPLLECQLIISKMSSKACSWKEKHRCSTKIYIDLFCLINRKTNILAAPRFIPFSAPRFIPSCAASIRSVPPPPFILTPSRRLNWRLRSLKQHFLHSGQMFYIIQPNYNHCNIQQ